MDHALHAWMLWILTSWEYQLISLTIMGIMCLQQSMINSTLRCSNCFTLTWYFCRYGIFIHEGNSNIDVSRKTSSLGVNCSGGILPMILVHLLIWSCNLCISTEIEDHWELETHITLKSISDKLKKMFMEVKMTMNEFRNSDAEFSWLCVALLFSVHSSNCWWNVWEDNFPCLSCF